MVIFMKLKEVYEEYINFTPLSRRTKEIYKYYFERFWLDRIGDIEICDLSYDIVQEGFNSLVKRYSYNTIKTYKSALIKVVEIAELKEGIVVNWKKHLYLGQRNAKKRYNANSMNEFIELMKHLYKCRSKNKKSYILACWIGFFTGARLGEVLALSTNDINIAVGEININKTIGHDGIVSTTKTVDSIRTVFMCEELKEILKKYLLTHENDILLPSAERGYITPNIVSSYISNWAKVHGYKIHFHTFREMFVKTMIDGGANIENVSALLGHANITTTLNIYTKTTVEEQKKDVERIYNNLRIMNEIDK